MRSGALTIVTSLIVIAACAESRNEPDRAAASPPVIPLQPAPPASPAPAAGNQCVHDGRWAACSVERRLRQAGFVINRIEPPPPRRPGFSPRPIAYKVGSARLEVFLYSDETSLTRDLAGIDTMLAVPRGTASHWEVAPMFMRSGNLAAVFLTRNQRQSERLVLAITAGAPQPGSPR